MSIEQAPRRILIVDDNAGERAELRRMIMVGAERRYQFEEADCTGDALRLMTLRDRAFDCVLLDQYLPDGTGTELVAHLSSSDGLEVPVVMVTVDTSMDVNRHALRSGAEDFVGKSWMTPVSLVRVIENAIERWTMARELRASEARFRQLAAAVPQAVWATDAFGRLGYANDRWRAYAGPNGDACRDGDWSGLVHPDDLGPGARIEDLTARRTPYQIDRRLLRADGVYRWHQVNAVPILDASGELAHWYGVDTDVHERIVATRRLDIEHGVSRCLASSRGLLEAAQKVLDILVVGLEMSVGTLWLLEADERLHCAEIVVRDGATRFGPFVDASRGLVCERGIGLAGSVWSTHEVQWTPSLGSSARAVAAATVGLTSGSAYPLLGDGRFLGVIELFGEESHEPDAQLREMFVSLGNELGQFILRERAERAIRDKDLRLRIALEASEIGLWTWDLVSDRVEWTERCYLIHGLKRGAFPGTGAAFFSLVHPDDRSRVETIVRAAVENRAIYECEFRIVRPSGETRWVENLGRGTYDAEGAPRGMLGSLRDIDERKRASERLAISEERLARAQQAANVGVWDWNVSTGEATWTDEAWQIFAGVRGGSSVVTYEVWLACLHPEDRERAAENVAGALRTGRYRDRFRVLHRDGVTRWAEVVATATFDADGSPSRLVGTVQDVTEKHDGEVALQRALAEAELAAKSREQLISLVSHDLRGPLSTLTLELSALALQRDVLVTASPKIGARLDRMARQTTAIANMIDGLLDAAVLQAGMPLALETGPVDLVALTRRVVALQAPSARAHRFEIITTTERITGVWDAARIERAVGNLVANAIKYSPAGGAVTIWIEEAGPLAVLRVRDEGIGISNEDVARIFQWFVRGANVARHSIAGTGIGLAGAKQIIELHGGTLSVDSIEGKGSTFVVSIPMQRALP